MCIPRNVGSLFVFCRKWAACVYSAEIVCILSLLVQFSCSDGRFFEKSRQAKRILPEDNCSREGGVNSEATTVIGSVLEESVVWMMDQINDTTSDNFSCFLILLFVQ